MKQLKATEFKTNCLSILDEVSKHGVSFEILKRGKLVARIIPARESSEEFPQANLKDSIKILGDIISPVMSPEEWESLRK